MQEPRLLQALRAHRGEVTCAEAAGSRLATAGGDRALLLWRWRRGAGWEEEARAERAHRYGASALRWAAGGVLLASGGLDGGVRLWSRELRALGALGAGRAAVRALCWAGRARLLAAHDCGAVRVWALRGGGGALLAVLSAHEGALHALATTPPHHALLLTACTTGVLKVFDLAEVVRSGVGVGGGPPPAPLTWQDGAHDLGALCARASAAGDVLATGGHDALVRLWRVERRGVRPGAVLAGHGAAVTALSWAAGERGALLASSSLDRTARLWAPPACLHVLHAHARYLTSLALEPGAAYLITGSNDKSVRMWALSSFSLDDELEPPCVALEHFGVGDLEGIEAVLEAGDEPAETEAGAAADVEDELSDAEAEGSGVRRLWYERLAQHGPINCITTHDDWLATASSDGGVRLYCWCGRARALLERWTSARAHQYPATSVDAGGGRGGRAGLLLSGGLDARACLWDVQSGVQLRVVSTEGGGGGGTPDEGAEAGGGGVRGARLSPHRPPRLLLATDDGLAALWTVDGADTAPACVFGGHAEGAWCCAWSHDGRLAATGAAAGELRVLAPPRAAPLAVVAAHEHGVQSCDFSPESARLELAPHTHLLATGGGDGALRLWLVEEGGEEGAVGATRVVEAHAGGVASVRWGAGAVLVSAGADGWARGWLVGARGSSLSAAWGARAAGAGGVLCAALLGAAEADGAALLACGTLAGELSVWRVPRQAGAALDDDAGTAPALWDAAGVLRWLRENVTRVPGGAARREEEAALERAAQLHGVTGAQLLHAPLALLMETFLEEEEESAEEAREEEESSLRATLRRELMWLRTPPPPHPALVSAAPHALLCPLAHTLLREPARAADGYTYERAHLLDWLGAAEAGVSPVSGRALASPQVAPNYALRRALRAFLTARGHGPPC